MLSERELRAFEGIKVESIDLIHENGEKQHIDDSFLVVLLGEHICVTAMGEGLDKATDICNIAAAVLNRLRDTGLLPMFWGTYTATQNLSIDGFPNKPSKEADNESGQD